LPEWIKEFVNKEDEDRARAEAHKKLATQGLAWFFVGSIALIGFAYAGNQFGVFISIIAIVAGIFLAIIGSAGETYYGSKYAALDRQTFCRFCGKKLPTDAIFCPYCGRCQQ
jgi:hypothetical protein